MDSFTETALNEVNPAGFGWRFQDELEELTGLKFDLSLVLDRIDFSQYPVDERNFYFNTTDKRDNYQGLINAVRMAIVEELESRCDETMPMQSEYFHDFKKNTNLLGGEITNSGGTCASS